MRSHQIQSQHRLGRYLARRSAGLVASPFPCTEHCITSCVVAALLFLSAAQIVAAETVVVADKDDQSSFVLADKVAALPPSEKHRLEQLLLISGNYDHLLDGIGIDSVSDIEAVLLDENTSSDKSFETVSNDQSSDSQETRLPSSRKLQPALLVSACSAPADDPKAEFHTTTGRGLRHGGDGAC